MKMVGRSEEVRQLISLSPQEVIQKSGNKLHVCKNLKALHEKFALDIFNELKRAQSLNQEVALILPIGPVGQYPILAKMINKKGISLENCWFFFMDEYSDDDGKALREDHPLSFKKIAKEQFFSRIKKGIKLNEDQIIFPDENNINMISELISNVGGIDTCYGGIGIHGHLAFNEPAENIANTDSRLVRLNDFTITINAIRSNVGGNLENFPKKAYTIGMKQILNARKIRLYCRNGSPYDWANTVLRIALLGEPGDDYPVTHIRTHPNYQIITDYYTLKTPKIIL